MFGDAFERQGEGCVTGVAGGLGHGLGVGGGGLLHQGDPIAGRYQGEAVEVAGFAIDTSRVHGKARVTLLRAA